MRVIAVTPHQGAGRVNMLMHVVESNTTVWGTSAKTSIFSLTAGEEETNLPVLRMSQ